MEMFTGGVPWDITTMNDTLRESNLAGPGNWKYPLEMQGYSAGNHLQLVDLIFHSLSLTSDNDD